MGVVCRKIAVLYCSGYHFFHIFSLWSSYCTKNYTATLIYDGAIMFVCFLCPVLSYKGIPCDFQINCYLIEKFCTKDQIFLLSVWHYWTKFQSDNLWYIRFISLIGAELTLYSFLIGAIHISNPIGRQAKGLSHLNLSHCGLTGKGVNMLAHSLSVNKVRSDKMKFSCI